MHTVIGGGLRVGIKSLMATVRGTGLKYRGVSSQQGLRTTGGLDRREVLQSSLAFLSMYGERFDERSPLFKPSFDLTSGR